MKKNIKKKVFLAIGLLLVFTLASCGNKSEEISQTTTKNTSSETNTVETTQNTGSITTPATTTTKNNDSSLSSYSEDQIKRVDPSLYNEEKVTFVNETTGKKLAGIIYTPKNLDKTKKYKTVIVDGPMLSVKEQPQSLYAKLLTSRGNYVTMVYDHTYFGESEGEPRRLEDPEMKAKDNSSAISYLEKLPYVDASKIAGVGICGGGSYMSYTASKDKRIKTVVSVVSPSYVKGFALVKPEEAKEAREQYEKGATGAMYKGIILPKTGDPVMDQGADYYFSTNRGAVPNRKNDTPVWSQETWENYDPVSALKNNLDVPYLVLTGENAFSRPISQEMFDAAKTTKKEIVVVPKANHFEMYDIKEYVEQNITKIQSFLGENLK